MKKREGYKIFNFIMKIISWCIMTILCTIGAFLIVYLCINKIAQAKGKNAPLGLYTIISPSMTPDIEVYDVVVVVHKNPEEIQVGDIISYYSTNSYFGDTPTHRVVEKFNTNNGVSFRTRGDANPVVDNEIVMADHVIGTVRLVIPSLGRVQFFLASKGGWFIAILVPAAGIIIYDLIKLSKLMSVKNKMKYAENLHEYDNKKRTRRNPNLEKGIVRKDTREIRYKKESNPQNDRISRLLDDLEEEKQERPKSRSERQYYAQRKNIDQKNKTSKRK